MKGCMQWNTVYSLKKIRFKQDWNPECIYEQLAYRAIEPKVDHSQKY